MPQRRCGPLQFRPRSRCLLKEYPVLFFNLDGGLHTEFASLFVQRHCNDQFMSVFEHIPAISNCRRLFLCFGVCVEARLVLGVEVSLLTPISWPHPGLDRLGYPQARLLYVLELYHRCACVGDPLSVLVQVWSTLLMELRGVLVRVATSTSVLRSHAALIVH